MRTNMPRHRSIERPPSGQHVRIERDGKVHEASYTVDGPIVTVDSLLLGIRSARLNDGTAEGVARIILTELLELAERRR
jgi:hypothetical protein